MGWNKVKIVMIAVLFAFNLYLLYMIREQARASEYIPEQSVSQMVKLLEKDGITVADGALSSKKESRVIYGGEIGEDYYGMAASAVSDSTVSLSFPTPNGVVLSMENGDRCAFDGGFHIRYEADGFAELLEKQGFFDGDAADFASGGSLFALSAREERELADCVERFLMRTGGITERSAPYAMQYDALFCGYDLDTRVQYFVCVQTVRDVSVTNLCSAFAVLDGTVIGMNGEWCFADIETTYSAQLYDQINILYSVKERIKAEGTSGTVITSISLVYAVYYHADTGSYYMIPTWNVTTDSGEVFLLNGVDGTFYTE